MNTDERLCQLLRPVEQLEVLMHSCSVDKLADLKVCSAAVVHLFSLSDCHNKAVKTQLQTHQSSCFTLSWGLITNPSKFDVVHLEGDGCTRRICITR